MSVGGWDHRGPSRCRSGLGQPCLPSLVTLRRRWVLGTQILAVKWLAMASFQGTGRSKRFIYNTGRLQINCINSSAVIFSFQSVFEVRDSLISD